MKRSIIVKLISILIAILFLYAAIVKLLDFVLFKEQIKTVVLLKPVARQIAYILPLSEFLLVFLLIAPNWRLKGLYASLFLLSAFSIYIIITGIIDKDLHCSCGGLLEKLSTKEHIAFNCAFIIINLIGIKLETALKRRKYTNKTIDTDLTALANS